MLYSILCYIAMLLLINFVLPELINEAKNILLVIYIISLGLCLPLAIAMTIIVIIINFLHSIISFSNGSWRDEY